MTASRPPLDYLEPVDLDRPDFGDLYDELPLWSAPFGLMLLERVPLRPGLTFLDVGAGTGFLSVELAQRCGPRSTVIAVDPWAAVMGRLRRKIEHLGLRNVRLLEQDAARLDLPDASVDVVVSNLGVNNFDNAPAVLRECRRVAKPGATLLLTTNLVGHMRELYEVYAATLREVGAADRLPDLEEHVQRRASPESLRRQLEGARFEVTAVETGSFRLRFADGASLLRHHFIRLGFVPAWKEVAPPGAVERTFVELERRLDALAGEHGELALTVPIACVEARRP
jgi:arsenite methyltransferase